MKFLKVCMLLVLFCNLSYCGGAKKAFSNQKKNSSDEFLVEKKSPLVMPPDYNKLPVPNEVLDKNEQNKDVIRDMIVTVPEDIGNDTDEENIDEEFEDLIIEKIKKN